jgi:hypothetical protein
LSKVGLNLERDFEYLSDMPWMLTCSPFLVPLGLLASFSLHYLFVMQNMSTAALAHMTESCVKDLGVEMVMKLSCKEQHVNCSL